MSELPSFEHIKDPDARALLSVMKMMIENQQSTIEQLSSKIDELTRLLRGSKPERMPTVDGELKKKRKRTETEEQKQERLRKAQETRRKNKEQKKQVETELVEHDIAQEELKCKACGDTEFERTVKGKASFEYEFIPAKIIQKKHIREKRMCHCGKTILTAPATKRVGDVCHHGPQLHAHVVVSKCQDHIPLHRMASQFVRWGVRLATSTLCDMFHRSARELKPLYDRQMELIAQSEYLNGDETRLQVQGKKKTRTAWIWTFLSAKMIGFVFSHSRSGQTPVQVLAGTIGKLQVDAYTGYNHVCLPEGRERVGCWAHARRKFFDAMPNAPDAQEALKFILELYEVEYEVAEKNALGTEHHLAMRRLVSQDTLDKFKTWLIEKKEKSLPKSGFGQAIGYTLNQWETLTRFVSDVRLPLDNNAAERALRPIALGRKNFLFVGNDEAGQNLAILQSLVSTCQLHGVNPQEYIADVLIRIQTHPSSRIDELLPMNWKPQA